MDRRLLYNLYIQTVMINICFPTNREALRLLTGHAGAVEAA